MTNAKWKLLANQGTRQVWERTTQTESGNTETQYRGYESSETSSELIPDNHTVEFETQTDALAWLNGIGS